MRTDGPRRRPQGREGDQRLRRDRKLQQPGRQRRLRLDGDRNGTVDIAPGGSFQTKKEFTDRWPYAWQVAPPGDVSLTELTWFIGKRVKNTSYVANDGSKSPRRWAMIFFDNSTGKALAKSTSASLKSQGITPKLYYVSSDPAQQAQQATPLVAQIKKSGVNSIVYGVNDAPADISLAGAFNSQNFFPDWYVSDESVMFKLAVFVNVLFPGQTKRLHGTGLPNVTATRVDVNPDGTNGTSAKLQANDWRTASVNAYKQAGGKAANPQNGADLEGTWEGAVDACDRHPERRQDASTLHVRPRAREGERL